MSRIQRDLLSPLTEAFGRAVSDEALLERIFTAMGPYSFDGKASDPKEWEVCLSDLRDRFEFDDSE